MNNFFLIFILILTLGCIKEEKPPEYILPEEKMVSILIDLHVLEGKVQQLRIKRDSSELVFNHFENEVFKKHNVTDSIYLKNLTYYYDHPQKMEKIYGAVLDSLSLYDRILEGNKSDNTEN